MEYFIAWAESAGKLEEEVNAKIAEGFKPFGNITHYIINGESRFIISMLKE